MTIQAIVFDIGDVLEINTGTGWKAKWETSLSLDFTDIFKRMETSGLDGKLGTCSEAQWLEGLRQFSGMNQMQTDALMGDFWTWYVGQPNTELIDYFASLRSSYKTAILSNSFLGARAREQARYGFEDITDLIVYSHEVGLAKPDPQIYALTCERLGLQPAEIVFLDDLKPNIAAAKAFGMHAVPFQNNAQAIAEIQNYLENA
jgi:epoxide hydrolase-like predicted phosphatase